MRRPLAVLILAAGKGTRMRSAVPKVLHRLLGWPLVRFPAELALALGAERIIAVVGHGAAEVAKALPSTVETAVQPEQRGTADAVRVGLGALGGFDGDVLVLSGDVPGLRQETVARLQAAPGILSLVTAQAKNPSGYGRILRGAYGTIQRVVEEKDASPEERAVREINAGIYRFDAAFLRAHLATLSTENAQGEFYLTDLVAIAAAQGVGSITAPLDEVAGVNDRDDLARVTYALRMELNRSHLRNGVTMDDPTQVTVEMDVKLGANIRIEPGCILSGRSVVGDDCVLRSHTILDDASVGAGCLLGPFARLRPGTVLADGVHLGNFVETKNARIAAGSKANHLSYLGDVDIGRGVNIGAGTITCNYDGAHKHLTRIGDGVFIGSDTQLVAPVTVGEGAYVAAGSTIVKDVPPNSLTLTRSPTVTKPEWATALREKRDAARKASLK